MGAWSSERRTAIESGQSPPIRGDGGGDGIVSEIRREPLWIRHAGPWHRGTFARASGADDALLIGTSIDDNEVVLLFVLLIEEDLFLVGEAIEGVPLRVGASALVGR